MIFLSPFYKKILTFIFFLSLFALFLLLVFLILNSLRKKVQEPSTSIFQYKITNWYLTIFIINTYLLFFIFFLYYMRIYFINHSIDLKNLYFLYLSSISKFSFLFKLYFLIYLILIMLIMIQIIIIIQKIFNNEFIKIHIYLYGQSREIVQVQEQQKYILYAKIFTKIKYSSPHNNDILTYCIKKYILFKIYFFLGKQNEKIVDKSSKIFKLLNLLKQLLFRVNGFFSTSFYRITFNLSPFLVILYDCFYHSFVLSHLYPYLVIFFPLSLSQRLFTKSNLPSVMAHLFYEICYLKQEKPFIYFIDKDLKALIDYYALGHLSEVKDKLLLPVIVDININIYLHRFFLEEEPGLFIEKWEGDIGDPLVLIKDKEGHYYERIYDYDENKYSHGQEWVLLF